MIQTTIRNDGRGSMCVPDEEGSAAGSAARTDRIRGRCGAGLKPHPTSSSKKYNEPPGRAIIGTKGGFLLRRNDHGVRDLRLLCIR